MSDSSSKSGKSWSLKNMLGRRGAAAKDVTGSTKAKTKARKSTKEEMECTTSIKERVLAKLREPVPELKQGARHSSAEAFSPRLCSSYETSRTGERESCTPSRFSTSSYWNFESEPVSSSSYTTTTTYQASLSPCSSHHYANRCSSPTSSNVIARLMGLGDASDTSSVKPTPLSSPRIRQHKSRAADTPTSRSSWIQEQSPRTIAGSPRDNTRTAQSPKSLECNGFSQRSGSRRDSAQDFLDEMEDHLKQCDRALERIEAVMELKKKLLYLNRTSATTGDHAYSSSSNNRVKHRQDVYKTSADVDSSSYLNYSTRDFSQAVNDVFIQMSTSRHSKIRHSRANSMDQILKRYEVKEVEPPASRSFQHRRSISDGETPVFRPGAFDLEQDFSNRSRELHKESFSKWESLQWDHPRTPEHKVMEVRAPSRPAKSNTLRTLFEQQQQQAVLQHKQIADSNSEQPSPVSVLGNIQDDSSEDDRDSSHRETRSDKKNVKRALWTTPAPAPADIAQTAAIKSSNTAANQASSSPNEAIADTDLLRRLDRTWATGIRMETAQLAVMIECIIFRSLVEETLKCLHF